MPSPVSGGRGRGGRCSGGVAARGRRWSPGWWGAPPGGRRGRRRPRAAGESRCTSSITSRRVSPNRRCWVGVQRKKPPAEGQQKRVAPLLKRPVTISRPRNGPAGPAPAVEIEVDGGPGAPGAVGRDEGGDQGGQAPGGLLFEEVQGPLRQDRRAALAHGLLQEVEQLRQQAHPAPQAGAPAAQRRARAPSSLAARGGGRGRCATSASERRYSRSRRRPVPVPAPPWPASGRPTPDGGGGSARPAPPGAGRRPGRGRGVQGVARTWLRGSRCSGCHTAGGRRDNSSAPPGARGPAPPALVQQGQHLAGALAVVADGAGRASRASAARSASGWRRAESTAARASSQGRNAA